MDKIRVDGFNGLRFTPYRPKGCFTPNSGSQYSNSFLSPFGINPNKAVFTIDSKTSHILIVNKNASQLLGYSSRELCDSKFSNLLACKNKIHVSALAENQFNSEDGTMVLLSGKVVEMITKSNKKVPVSLWIRQIDNEGRCLAVAEPVERRVAQLIVDSNGFITNGDYESLLLFQLESIDKFVGMDLTLLIPAIQLPDIESNIIPKHIRKQRNTGKTQDGVSFPLCLMISHQDNNQDTSDSGHSNNLYVITIWVYSNLSGLIVLDENSIIESCNHHFSTLMFGYPQTKIVGQNIFRLIPNFGQEFEYIDMSSRRSPSLENEESETETENILLNDSFRLYSLDDISNAYESSQTSSNLENTPLKFSNKSKIDPPLPTQQTPVSKNIVTSTPDIRKRSLGSNILNTAVDYKQPLSASYQQPQQFNYNYVDGKYKGEAIHCDGNIIDIVYTIYKHTLPTNQKIYCVWISRDPDSEFNNEEDEEEKQFNLTLTLNSITSTIDTSVGPSAMKNTASSTCVSNATNSMINSTVGGVTIAGTNPNSSRPNSVSLVSQCEEEQICGEYGKHYTTLKQIGKGAYGYVKMAYRNSDRLLVISKFILKEKLCPNFMVLTDEKKEIPMEIYLLKRVKHPNIVSVMDVYENEKFFQMIMEKHGSGMDLFEFIDRRPLIDEKLGCYIFRQIARAVDYLHTINILHRDIKDENIIIDQNFQIKLIDFGSATFMQEGKMFSTFYGTTEYCSPEVLAGNKYQGPELEMWSLGVTLYVLMFFENPFLDMEDTLKADLMIPQDVSVGLEALLLKMLDKDPKTRISMKELLSNEWISMEIVNNFNFPFIVPCEPYEANPEVYYTGQAYSSATALSTSHDSLSMADDEDESMIDQDDDMKLTPHQAQAYSDVGSEDFDKTGDLNAITKVSTDDINESNRKCCNKINNSLLLNRKASLKKLNVNKKCPFTHLPMVDLSTSPITANLLFDHQPSSSNYYFYCHNDDDYTAISPPPQTSNSSCLVTPNLLTTSKSENNIFDKNLSLPLQSFDVSSLSDLNEDSYGHSNKYTMNDLSKTQILNHLSNESMIDGKIKKTNRY
ncbi:unnamed protein product [Diamesa serratosioi]